MPRENSLFEVLDFELEVPAGLHMVAGLTGFTDAGNAMRQVADHILGSLDSQMIVQFTNDELLDYRSRRPVMFFEQDHLADYQPAVLAIYLVKDEVGNPFLFLHGYEPDFKWEAFADAIEALVDFYQVSDFTWLHAIPFPIPHTRAVGVTVSGNQPEVIAKNSEWKPRTQVPGNVMHLLEYRLSKSNLPMTGFVLLVPHYLGDSEYPQAAVKGFELITSHTGLVFPTDDLRAEGLVFERRLAGQMLENQDLARMVANLETSFKSERATNGMSGIRTPDESVPDAEQLAAELEGYLASHQKNKRDDETNDDLDY